MYIFSICFFIYINAVLFSIVQLCHYIFFNIYFFE